MINKLLALFVISFPLFCLATPADDALVLRTELEAQFANPSSNLNETVKDLRTAGQIPSNAVFSLLGSDLLWHGETVSTHECQQEKCYAYERTYFRQLSEIRWVSDPHSQPQLIIWPLGIDASVLETWESNTAGDKIKILNVEPQISHIFFFDAATN